MSNIRVTIDLTHETDEEIYEEFYERTSNTSNVRTRRTFSKVNMLEADVKRLRKLLMKKGSLNESVSNIKEQYESFTKCTICFNEFGVYDPDGDRIPEKAKCKTCGATTCIFCAQHFEGGSKCAFCRKTCGENAVCWEAVSEEENTKVMNSLKDVVTLCGSSNEEEHKKRAADFKRREAEFVKHQEEFNALKEDFNEREDCLRTGMKNQSDEVKKLRKALKKKKKGYNRRGRRLERSNRRLERGRMEKGKMCSTYIASQTDQRFFIERVTHVNGVLLCNECEFCEMYSNYEYMKLHVILEH